MISSEYILSSVVYFPGFDCFQELYYKVRCYLIDTRDPAL